MEIINRCILDTIDFMGSYFMSDSSLEEVFAETDESEEVVAAESDEHAVEEVPAGSEKTTSKIKKQPNDKKSNLTDESAKYFIEYFSEQFSKIVSAENYQDKLSEFLIGIGFPDSKILKKVFIASCTVKKVTYEAIIIEICEKGYKNPSLVENILKQEFKGFLEKHPAIKEKYPRITIIRLLKAFSFTINK